jgi:hypothetical protein
MDIELSEYEVLPIILDMVRENKIEICHILLELHDNGIAADYRDLVLALEKTQFFMYSKEILFCGFCAEYSFLHSSCFEQYGVSQDSILYTMQEQHDTALNLRVV